MIEPESALSVSRQCELPGLTRSAVYYQPKATPTTELVLLRRLDDLHLEFPCMGSRSLRDQLVAMGFSVGRDRLPRLMRQAGIRAVYRRLRSTIPAQGHKIYPYLLSSLIIDRPNQVWAADITYIPTARGFMYLVAIMDWHSRRVLSARLSNTMSADFCVEALEETLALCGPPEIFNIDQGSQFTGKEFIGVPEGAGIKISMDSKGRWLDNVFIERLWRSVKYKEVYLRAYDTIAEARAGLKRYCSFYNRSRTHQSLDRRTPYQVCFQTHGLREAAHCPMIDGYHLSSPICCLNNPDHLSPYETIPSSSISPTFRRNSPR
jgi:putative transposase